MKTSLTTLALLGTALAVPEVQVVPSSPNSCTTYPNRYMYYNRDYASPFEIISDQADNSAANLLRLTTISVPGPDGASVSTLAVSRCTDCAIGYWTCDAGEISQRHTNGAPVYRVSRDADNAVAWSREGYKLGIYRHLIDGVDQTHKYWGAENRTTWGFKEEVVNGREVYLIKLLGLPVEEGSETEAEWEPEFEGFVRVIEPGRP